MGILDVRAVAVSQLQDLLSNYINNQHPFDGTYGLFTLSSISFTKLCLDHWRRQIDTQILRLINLFVESDDNSDGVLTLDEFSHLMKTMEER